MKQQAQIKITSSLLAKNTVLNFIGQVVPLLIGILTIPFIIRGLGKERFGLLSLAWVVLGYFLIFDLGLGRATTKFVAEALGKGKEKEIPHLVWTAIAAQALFGIAGGFLFFGITPFLVERVLNIPPELINEAKITFYLLAFSIPVILISGSFRGALEASQRFDLVNAVKIPMSSLIFLLPLLGLFLGLGLPGIVALLLLAKVGALIALIILNFRLNPDLKKSSISFSLFPRLFSFGGWVTVSSIVGPILVYLDRFLIGSLLSLAAVAYYTAPYEAVTRLWIIAGSLTMTLFPAFSALAGISDREKFSTLFARSIKYTLLILGPIVVIIGLFAKEILQIWLGTDFAIKSTLVLQVLGLGVLINSLGFTPFALLQGIGRPDLPAKFHLLELPFYIGTAWILISKWGIVGAAGVWTLRVMLDTLLLFLATFKIYRFSPRLLVTNGLTLSSLVILMFGAIAYVLKSFIDSFPLFAQITLLGGLFGLFAWIIWAKVIDALDRSAILKMVKL